MDTPRLVAALDEALVDLDRAGKGWRTYAGWPDNDRGSILLPPATEEAISHAEKSAGFPFPPSYRRFLQVSNGWIHFWGDYTLVGLGDEQVREAVSEIAENVQEQTEDLESELGSLEPTAISDWEASEERYLYLPRCLVVGSDSAGAMWVYDPLTADEAGEMSLTLWDISYGAQDPRFQTFDDFLEWALDETRTRLRMEFGGDDD